MGLRKNPWSKKETQIMEEDGFKKEVKIHKFQAQKGNTQP